MILAAGRLQSPARGARALEHAKHDGADKGEGHIGGNDAQSADESHGESSLVHVATRLTLEPGERSPRKRDSAVVP